MGDLSGWDAARYDAARAAPVGHDERTLLVPISHVFFRSAFIQDAKAIIAKAEKVGAMVVLDVFQSVGTVPLKLGDWGCHAAVGGALKFLCGGPGACFLYVRPDLIEFWFGVRFRLHERHRHEWRDGAWHYRLLYP